MLKCDTCGTPNKCCIARIGLDGKPKKYCCQCVPKDPLENFDKSGGESCGVLNLLCCYSRKPPLKEDAK